MGASLSRFPDPSALAIARREFDAYGVQLVATPEAIAALGEALTITHRLWTESEPFDFEGRCYGLRGAIGEPKPVHPPGARGAAPSALRPAPGPDSRVAGVGDH